MSLATLGVTHHHSQHSMAHQQEPLPQWNAFSTYFPGVVVWYRGTFWRCELSHTSGREPMGAPNSNFHLWTPVGSSGPHPHHYSAISPTPYAGPPQPEILSPVPLQMPAKPPPIGESSSPDTTTGDDDKGGRMGFFQAKAAESMRYIAYREETQKEKDEKELRAELKGKRVWKVGGIGMMAYSLDPALEKKKKRIWSKESGKEEEWVHAARTRTKLYTDSRGVKPLVMWKLVENGPVPRDAMPLGSEEDGALLFAARAWREGGLHLGKAGHHLANHATISCGGKEHSLDVYEVLCGPPDPELVKWMTFRHGENALVENWQPVEGGRESNGSVLLIGKGEYENGEHPGKCLIDDDHVCVGYGGGELWVRPFQVLAYSSTTIR